MDKILTDRSHVLQTMPLLLSEKIFLALLPSLLLFTRVLADLTVLLVVIAFLFHCKTNNNWAWAKSLWFRWVWLFWAYLLLVNLPLSTDSSDSLLYAITFIRWPLFAVAIGFWLLHRKEQQRWFLVSLILTSVFILSDTVWQYIWGVDWFGIPRFLEDRLTGPFRNPLPGTLMLRVWFIMGFAILLFEYFQAKPARQIMWLLALLFCGLCFIFITGERMAFIVFATGTMVILAGLLMQYQNYRKHVILSLGILALLFTGVILSDPTMMDRTLLSVSEKLMNFFDSDYGRVFRAAFAAWEAHPIFGSGLHTYKQICVDMGILESLGMMCTHPHNLYLHLLAETGLIGTALFIAMLAGIYLRTLMPLFQQKKWLKLALCFTVMTASFFPLIGGKSVLNNWIAALVWLGVGWCLAMSNQSQRAPRQPKV